MAEIKETLSTSRYPKIVAELIYIYIYDTAIHHLNQKRNRLGPRPATRTSRVQPARPSPSSAPRPIENNPAKELYSQQHSQKKDVRDRFIM
jgi:hypothetical protein